METNDKNNVYELSLIYAALGEETRLALTIFLIDNPSSVSDISEKLNMPQPKVSHHLRILKDARIVKPKRCGKNVIYETCDEHINEIVKLGMIHMEC